MIGAMVTRFLSARALRFVALTYALCLLYLLAAPVAFAVLVVLLLFRATTWAIERLDGTPGAPPGHEPPPDGGLPRRPVPPGRW